MKSKIILLLLIFVCQSFYGITKQSINNYYKSIKKWTDGRSSALIEKDYDRFYYEQFKIWDKDLSTAWVEGAPGNGIGEWIVIDVRGQYQGLTDKDSDTDKKIKTELKINNGFCKSEKTFKNNNRVKKAKITFYEVPVQVGQSKTIAIEDPQIFYETEIELKDTMDEQTFSFISSPKVQDPDNTLDLYLKLTILDVYPGEKFQDTCISEMSANAEIIKENTVEKQKKPAKVKPKKLSWKEKKAIKEAEAERQRIAEEEQRKKEEIDNLEWEYMHASFDSEIEAMALEVKEIRDNPTNKSFKNKGINFDAESGIDTFEITKSGKYNFYFEYFRGEFHIACSFPDYNHKMKTHLQGKLKNYHKDESDIELYWYFSGDEEPVCGESMDNFLKTHHSTACGQNIRDIELFFLENLDFVIDDKVVYSFTPEELHRLKQIVAFVMWKWGLR